MWSVLNYRSVIEVAGVDRIAFLQGLVTQDVSQVKEGRPLYGLMLTSKGRYGWDFFIIQHGDKIWLTPGAEKADLFLKKLSLYRLKSDVSLTLLQDHVVAVHASIASALPGGYVFKDPRHDELGFVYVGPQQNIEEDHDTSPYEARRLYLNVPEGPLDLEFEKSIPLEARMDALNAISWTKGCYLGQELTARTKHIGVVRKTFCAFMTAAPVQVGQAVTAQGQEVGTIKSVYEEGKKGFLLLRQEHVEADLFVNDIPLRVRLG